MSTAMAHAMQMQEKLREESRSYETLAEGASRRRARDSMLMLMSMSMSAECATMTTTRDD
jgi:hypothetical protein|tara:strand:+ start:3151 stop:3330 length:180 start_codon:yes stop_codon:yes gene_type:complete